MTESHDECSGSQWLNMATAKAFWAERLSGLIDPIASEKSSFWDIAKDVVDAKFESGKDGCFSAQDHKMMSAMAPHVKATLLHEVQAMLELYESKFFDEDTETETVSNLLGRANALLFFYQNFTENVH